MMACCVTTIRMLTQRALDCAASIEETFDRLPLVQNQELLLGMKATPLIKHLWKSKFETRAENWLQIIS